MARHKKSQSSGASKCIWTYVSDDWSGDSWDTACGEKFQFNSDGPQENSFRFCPYCGLKLKEIGR